ncbi:MAG TPA: hypothetical protein VHY91_00245 [Pirellulales bacterium]|jgi:hypothetical protein|nr:hypothetical protein [Pirellulales bacterium]
MNYEPILAIAITCTVMAAAYFFESYEKLFRRPRYGLPLRGKAKTLGA